MKLNNEIPWDELKGAKVVLGLSGGVDSSVSAAILKQHGLEVTALFMKNWEEDDTDSYCAAAKDREDAQKVCDKLGIELKTINFAAEYWDRVFENFLSEYRAGRTPNPDVLCNKEIKFKAFFDYAVNYLKADFIATGHYATRSFHSDDGLTYLMRSADENKDQSYFLYAIDGDVLARVLFPVGSLHKRQVRQKAASLGLVTADKKDSTGICFIGEKRFKEFLKNYLPAQKGEIVTKDGTVIGEHEGIMYYTIGQRKGLHIGGRSDGTGEPWYVAEKDVINNRLIAAQGRSSDVLHATGLFAVKRSFIAKEPSYPVKLTCKIRYRQQDLPCTVTEVVKEDADADLGCDTSGNLNGEKVLEGSMAKVPDCSSHDTTCLKVMFDKPVPAVAPGQSVVFYDGPLCLGGAVIDKAVK